MLKLFIPLAVLITLYSSAQKTELKRKAFIAMGSRFTDAGILLTRVDSGGTIEKLGLKRDDVMTEINGIEVGKEKNKYFQLIQALREDDDISIKYLRGGKAGAISGKVTGLRKEKSDKLDIIYDWTTYGNGKLRTLVRTPKGNTNIPAILFIHDFPCWTIDAFRSNPMGKLLNQWAEGGYAVITIEKTGIGDNENTAACETSDLLMDIGTYTAGYKYMEQLPFVDKNNLYIWGWGTGGIVATEIARQNDPKGVMVFGTFFRPWSEFWLNRLRMQSFLNEKDAAIVEDQLRTVQKIFYEFFTLKKSPAALHDIPEYTKAVEYFLEYKKDNDILMQRHWRYWQQLDSISAAKNWKQVKAHVLSICGGADYEAHLELDHQLIADVVNTYNPGFGTYIRIDDLDHTLRQSPGMKEIITGTRTYLSDFNTRLSDATTDWMNRTRAIPLISNSIIIPRDTSLLDLVDMAKKITAGGVSVLEKVKKVIEWANSNLEWTATDYKSRTAKQIICRKGGNCNEEAMVVRALLNEVNVKTRRVREINIQPESKRREQNAINLINERGVQYSVFGLRHNDHVWIEFYNEETNKWLPADPTIGLIGLQNWVKARVGFDERPVHNIMPYKDMLVPFCVFALNENGEISEDRTDHYLVNGFNEIYNKQLSKKSSWKEWKKLVRFINPHSQAAFEGKENLHQYNNIIQQIEETYKMLKLR